MADAERRDLRRAVRPRRAADDHHDDADATAVTIATTAGVRLSPSA